MFESVLIANRGEIALRIQRACHGLGLRTIVVYSEADRDAFYVGRADVAVCIGPAAATASYLDQAAILLAAEATGADAVHPGYGFLAENATFAERVTEAGLSFIGPDAACIRTMGDKVAAKRAMRAAGVPCVPGPDVTLPDDPDAIRRLAGEIGYPVIVKAAGGGGGRGMRVVHSRDELTDALEAARREAKAAFGDDRVFAERYVERPRHIEIQLLGDAHGNVVALGERECSIQRRHQKVLEESPSPALDPSLRAAMSEAAVRFARAIGYTSAGTAEFMLDGRDFYFLELNGRIQVEHPVTELVTGLDLVAEQLRIASGEAMSRVQESAHGHAVEVRLYAEDPRTFLPQGGRIRRLVIPASVRVDAGVAEGDEIELAYDPMIAKLIAHGPTRDAAFDRLEAALAETVVEGVTTNLPLLRWLVTHPDVRAGRTTTAFLTDHPPLSPPPVRVPSGAWRGAWRLNLPAPPPAPPPDLETAAQAGTGAHGESEVTAPMPGTVIKVLVAEGDQVHAREPLVVVEAMKMETPLTAPYDAVVRKVNVAEGDSVQGGAVLIELED
jgi:acetyl-CoA carboxylase biotin carboxylase subunit